MLQRLLSAISALALATLLIPAIQPLLTTDLTCGYDNAFHLWRSVQIANCLRQGYLYPRWAPDMAHGYGLPLFTFHSPLTAYIVALLNLIGLSWSVSLNVTFITGMLLAGWFTFVLVRDLFGPGAGSAAAIAYVFAPFLAYDTFNRGSLSESYAWAFLPLVLWAVHRWSIFRESRYLLVAAVGLAGLILTHILFAFLFAPLLVAWVLVESFLARDWGVIVRGALAGMLGLGMSAFFWLPGLAERGWVQTERLLGTWVFDYRYNFLNLRQLLALPRVADSALINDWPPKALGLLPVAIALLSLLRYHRLSRLNRWRVALLWASTACFALLTLPISRPLWDHLPLLPYIQFPWRFLGPAAFCIALLVGAFLSDAQYSIPSAQYPPPSSPTLQSIALIILIILGNLGWFYPRRCTPPDDTSIAGMIAWERGTDTLGTTAKGEYLPIWVERMPDAEGSRLDAAYAAGEPIVRLPSESLPENAQIIRADYGPVDATVEVETPTPFRTRYLAFYYPGWHVTVDDQPVPVTPTSPDGLISFEVPAGRHTIQVRFSETPLRLAADALSLLSLAAVVALTLSLRHRHASHTTPEAGRFTLHVARSHLSPGIWHLALAAVLLIVKLAVLDRPDSPLRRSNLVQDHLRSVDVPIQVTFGDEFIFLGHDTVPRSIASGDWFEITTYWQAQQPGGGNYGVAINVIDAQGHHWQGAETRTPRWHRRPPPVREWPSDQYAIVSLSSQLFPGTPPGEYTIEAVAFDRATLAPLTAHDADGHALGPKLVLGQITVFAPRRPAHPDELSIRHRYDTSLGPLTLLSADLDRDTASPGDPVLLTTFWRTDQQPTADLSIRVSLLAPDGSSAAEFIRPATTPWHPTSAWRSGDVWRGQHFLRLPLGLDNGDHQWEMALCQIDGSECTVKGQAVTLGRLRVYAPERLWQAPPLGTKTDARMGNAFTLLGYSLKPETPSLTSGTAITVTLVWQAAMEIDTSYRVFLHLLDPSGELVAQVDGEPANWSRPTTGWLPGEIVLDPRVLAIPSSAQPGKYRLQAGLYTQETGRLLTDDGADVLYLGTIVIGGQ